MTTDSIRRVDVTGLKVGQALTIILLLIAFVINAPWLVALVAIAQLLGALDLPVAPYRVIYKQVLEPRGVVKAKVVEDNPEPHRFAMLVGAIFNFAGVSLIYGGAPVIGWALVWIVIALANLNFWLNFCAGCWMYYQFNRLGIPGFKHAPIRES